MYVYSQDFRVFVAVVLGVVDTAVLLAGEKMKPLASLRLSTDSEKGEVERDIDDSVATPIFFVSNLSFTRQCADSHLPSLVCPHREMPLRIGPPHDRAI